MGDDLLRIQERVRSEEAGFGAPLAGMLSDTYGRRAGLWIGSILWVLSEAKENQL